MIVRSLTTGPDAEWVVTRSGRELAVLAGGAAPVVGKFALSGDDADLAMIHGPPNVALVATRTEQSTEIALHLLPELDVASKLELRKPARIAALCAGRVIMLSTDQRELTIVRATGNGLSAHAPDVQGETVEFVVGLERNQLVVSRHRKVEVWDAISGRPLRKLGMDLPPPPRTVGVALGNLWVVRPKTDEVLAYRLSDGRPFRHYVGANIDAVISHPGSPIVVFATPRGLMRLHCFAHSLMPIDSPWQAAAPVPLAQLVDGEEITLLGWPEGTNEPWRVALSGPGAAPADRSPVAQPPISTTVASESSASTGVHPSPFVGASQATAGIFKGPSIPDGSAIAPSTVPSHAASGSADDLRLARIGGLSWRQDLVAFAQEYARGVQNGLPSVPVETEMGELAYRLGLGPTARRALTALYAFYLIGEPMRSIASLARMIDDWAEPLGQGQLASLAMIERTGGHIGLVRGVTDVLDGQAPREIRLLGDRGIAARAGIYVLARDGRTDIALEADLSAQLGRIAVIESARVADALLEARVNGATAVIFRAPSERPRPWPQGASLVVVVDEIDTTAWLANAARL